MKKNVIFIYGASGSGTTTLGEYISKELGFHHMDTDDYFWLPTNPPFTRKREPEERVRLMKAEIEQHDKVVITGSMEGWGDVLIPYFTLAIRIEIDPRVRLERLEKRERTRFGPRVDKGGDMYQLHQYFMEWATNYDKGGPEVRSKVMHDVWQKKFTCKILELTDCGTVEEEFRAVKTELDKQ